LNRQEDNGEEAHAMSLSKSLGTNILKLMSGKVASQVITFVTAPIIARLFSPHDFGVRQIFVSIANTLIVVSSLRYEFSIPLGKNKRESSISFMISLSIALAFTMVVSIIVLFGKKEIAQWFKSPELSIFLWLLPLAVFMNSLIKSLRYWSASEGRFGAMAWSGFGTILGGRLVSILWAVMVGASAIGLFAGYLAGFIFGASILALFLGRELIFQIRNSEANFETIWALMKRHKKFPIFSTLSGLLNTISIEIPVIIFGLYFSKTVVGHYSLGHRLIRLPAALLGSSISQVFFPTAAKQYNEKGTLSGIVSNTFKKLVQIGIFPTVALGLFGMPLFGFVFGEKWIEAGIYAQILSGYVLLRFLSSPLSSVFTILQRQGTLLAFNVGLVSSRALVILLFGRISGPRMALAAYTVVSMAGYIFVCFLVLHSTSVSLRWASGVFLKYMVSSSLLLLPMAYFVYIRKSRPFTLVSLFLAVIIYMWGLYRFDASFRILFQSLLGKRRKRDAMI